MQQIRYAGPRVRRLREALKLTKAEAARRAQLTPSQYSWFEPAKGERRGYVFYVPVPWLERLAIALGTTAEYIAQGKFDAQPLPPRDPRRAMASEFERERAKLQRDIRRYERNRVKLERHAEQIANELALVRKMGDAAIAQRADDAEFFREMAKSILVDDYAGLTEAAERMARGEPARPDYEIVETTDEPGILTPRPITGTITESSGP